MRGGIEPGRRPLSRDRGAATLPHVALAQRADEEKSLSPALREPSSAGAVKFDPATLPRQAVATAALETRGLRFRETLGDQKITTLMNDIAPPEDHLLAQAIGEITA